MKFKAVPRVCTLTFLYFFLGLAACTGSPTPTEFSPPTPVRSSTPTTGTVLPTEIAPNESPTPFNPVVSPTPGPVAFAVNGMSLPLEIYEAELARLRAAVPDLTAEESADQVIGELIDQLLLIQGANELGFTVGEALLDERMARLTDDVGGEQALVDWQTANGYTMEAFREDLRRGIAAAWMRDEIIAAVPQTAEQVRARHILVSSRSEAESVLAQLNGGTSFDILLSIYDPISLGELGWFPRGTLFEPAVEEAAFALEPGSYSGVVETDLGFHIVQTTDYEAERPLDQDTKLVLQAQALERWLAARRAESNIEVFVP